MVVMMAVAAVVVLSFLCSSTGAALDGNSSSNATPVMGGRNNVMCRNKRSTHGVREQRIEKRRVAWVIQQSENQDIR